MNKEEALKLLERYLYVICQTDRKYTVLKLKFLYNATPSIECIPFYMEFIFNNLLPIKKSITFL